MPQLCQKFKQIGNSLIHKRVRLVNKRISNFHLFLRQWLMKPFKNFLFGISIVTAGFTALPIILIKSQIIPWALLHIGQWFLIIIVYNIIVSSRLIIGLDLVTNGLCLNLLERYSFVFLKILIYLLRDVHVSIAFLICIHELHMVWRQHISCDTVHFGLIFLHFYIWCKLEGRKIFIPYPPSSLRFFLNFLLILHRYEL